MIEKVKIVFREIKQGENLDLYLTILVSLVVAFLGAFQIVNFGIISAVILTTLAILLSSLITSRRTTTRMQEASEKLIVSIDKLGDDIHAKGNISDSFLYGYPDFSELFHSAKRISILGMVLSNTVTRYNSDFVQILKRGTELRFIVGKPTPEVLEMQSFRSSLIKDKDFMINNNQMTLTTLKATQKTSPAPNLLQTKTISYVPPFGMVIIEGLNGVSKAYIRIQTFQTPAPEQPTFVLDSQMDGKWFEFFSEQFERFWEASTPAW